MWEAARAYFVEAAYPEVAFPKTGDDARCVLCQQPLPAEASDRLSRFEQFIRNSTQAEEEDAAQAIESFRDGLSASRLSLEAVQSMTALLKGDLDKSDIADQVRRFAVSALWHLRSILPSGRKPDSVIPALPEEAVSSVCVDLERRAAALTADADSPERKALQRELAELEDRLWLAGIKEDVLLEIARRKEIEALEQAAQHTRHNEITRKSSDLSEALVTNRLRGRFVQEVDALGIGGLALELRKERATQGAPQFRVCLIHKPDQKAGEILSEGEHRSVALAAFLAELSTTDNNSGIVFDDPISSLDHLHREAIARRLADEGRNRQVIVFTHDLPFLFLLEQHCREGSPPDARRTEVAIRHVQKRAGRPGYCVDTPPNKAQKARSRVESIQRHLDNSAIQYERDPEGQWLYTAKGILSELRDTWEAGVEEISTARTADLLQKVNTRGLSRLSAIRLEDAQNMRTAYGRCSVLLHKASDALNPAIPTPDQIGAEIDALRQWIDDLKSRQEQIAEA